ncbi:hypothetical protein OQA88_11904 [Cercophora sp. LCS_1]
MEFAVESVQLPANGGDAHPTLTPASASAPGPAVVPALSDPAPPVSDAGADAGADAPANPRKRKKASRACDFCHVNHQPCDNGKPKCSVCTKHNKPCLYLRPTKRRGPQKGYRTALNTYKESAAAWGAVLGAIPGLDALIEGHLRGSTGKYIISSIKDTAQQEALINKWQESSVFKAFFGHNSNLPGAGAQGDASSTVPEAEAEDDDYPAGDDSTSIRPTPPKRLLQSPTAKSHTSRPSPKADFPSDTTGFSAHISSLSDILAKDAAQSSTRESLTLASLGFAPNETIADFYSMGSNPEPIPQENNQELDPDLGTESEQRAYYELLMGRSFPA